MLFSIVERHRCRRLIFKKVNTKACCIIDRFTEKNRRCHLFNFRQNILETYCLNWKIYISQISLFIRRIINQRFCFVHIYDKYSLKNPSCRLKIVSEIFTVWNIHCIWSYSWGYDSSEFYICSSTSGKHHISRGINLFISNKTTNSYITKSFILPERISKNV